MSLAGRLRQHIGFDTPSLEEAVALGEGDGLAYPSDRASIHVLEAGDCEDPLADLRRDELVRAPEVGVPELRAAALMVAEGLARRVILTGFETWPGLLTEIESLSRQLDLSILPTIVRPGGRIDLVVSSLDANAD